MEIGIIEGAITISFKLYKAHFDIIAKMTIFFMKFVQLKE